MTDAAILEGLGKSRLAVELNDDERRILADAMTLRDLTHRRPSRPAGSSSPASLRSDSSNPPDAVPTDPCLLSPSIGLFVAKPISDIP